MSIRGTAFVALWNDVDGACDAEYEAWHTFEHVPERVANPGFVDARRYRAAERTTGRYFTLYTLASLDALRSPRYADVVERPTPWSQRMRPRLRAFRRYACDVVAAAGRGRGAAIGTLVADAGDIAVDAPALGRALAGRVERDGVVALSLGRADTSSGFPLASALDTPASERSPYVVLVEALDRAAADANLAQVDADCRAHGMSIVRRGCYDLVFDVDRASLRGADEARPLPREDLRHRFDGD